jgi:hypothetical protein
MASRGTIAGIDPGIWGRTPLTSGEDWGGRVAAARIAAAQVTTQPEEHRRPTRTVAARRAANCGMRGPKRDLQSVDGDGTSMLKANKSPAHGAHSLPVEESIQNGCLDLVQISPLAVGTEHLGSAFGRQPLVHHKGAEIALFEQALKVGLRGRAVGLWLGCVRAPW